MKQDIYYYLKYIGIPLLIIVIIVAIYVFRGLSVDPLTENKTNNFEQQDSVDQEKEFDAPEKLSIPVLVYHQIRNYRANDSAEQRQYIMPPYQLERHLQYLSDNSYTPLTFAEIQEIFKGN